MRVNVREAVLNSLVRCEKDGRYSNIELDAAVRKLQLEGVDRSFFTVLLYGVTERKITLDYVIGLYSNIPLSRLDIFVLNLLRLGIYQILYLDRVPDSAACNEAVEIAKRRFGSNIVGYINAVLRETVRNKEKIPYPAKERDLISFLSVWYSCPEWLCSMWNEMYGAEKAESLLHSLNCRPYMTLQTNTLKISRDHLIARLKNEGVACAASRSSKSGIRLTADIPVSKLPIEEGLCFVQDEASQICAEALDTYPGALVIDTCAAPGGKSFSCAIAMENRGKVISLDLHENKLSLIGRGASLLGIDIIETAAQNGTVQNEAYIEIADRVLCDVPCSGLGVIAKKPDLRYKKPEDIERLPSVQYQILKTGSQYVKCGGYLVYSTCTLNIRENEDVVIKFLAEHPHFSLDAFGMKTFFPSDNSALQDSTDGFFIAKLKRKEEN